MAVRCMVCSIVMLWITIDSTGARAKAQRALAFTGLYQRRR
jgi:hypothetical protein